MDQESTVERPTFKGKPIDPREFQLLKRLEEKTGKPIPCQINPDGHVIFLDLGSRDLKDVPDEVFEFKELEVLVLEHNNLEKLPERISQLSKLQELYLNANHLQDLPEGITRLQRLRKLDISGNHLQDLPKNFARLTNLKKLFTHGQKMFVTPEQLPGDFNWIGVDSFIIIDDDEKQVEEDGDVEHCVMIKISSEKEDLENLPKFKGFVSFISNAESVSIRLSKMATTLKQLRTKWLDSTSTTEKQLGASLNRLLLSSQKQDEEKTLWQKIKEQKALAYILGSALILTIIKQLLPDTSSFLQGTIAGAAILVYFILQLYSGITLDRFAFSFTEKAETVFIQLESAGMMHKFPTIKKVIIAFLEKLQSSMGIIIGIIWMLSIKAVGSKSRTAQLIESIDEIDLVALQILIRQGISFLKDFFTVFPLDHLVPSIPGLVNFFFEDITGIFFRTAGILLIFWAIYDKGWKVVLDPTMVEDRESGKDKLDWYERLALPLGVFFAFVSITVDRSSLQGYPTYLFQLGLAIGGVLFLIREKRKRFSMGLVIVTTLTLFSIGYLLRMPIAIDGTMFSWNALLALLITYLLVMPGIIPRRCSDETWNLPLLTIKPTIFTYLGQPKVYMDVPRSFWKSLAIACNVDPFLPGFFAIGAEGRPLKERVKKIDLATLVFLLEFYVLVPLLIWLILIRIPLTILVVIMVASLVLTFILHHPLPNFAKKGITLNPLTNIRQWLAAIANFGISSTKEGIIRMDLSSLNLSSLPESFGQLSNLQWLYLEGNQLNSLPENFGHLTSLKALSLADNQLNSLPESFGQLTSLETLYLQYNQLTSLPESITNLTNLTWLDLSGNPKLRLSRRQEQWLKDLKNKGCTVLR